MDPQPFWLKHSDPSLAKYIMRSVDGMPPVLVPLLIWVLDYASRIQPPQAGWKARYDAIELFAGQAAISCGCAAAGLNAVAYDIEYGPSNDIMSESGFARACELIMQASAHGMLWVGVVCSSWVWISRSGSGRSAESAEGFLQVPRIKSANRMACHVTMLLLLGWRRGLTLFVEQPVSSVLGTFTPIAEMFAFAMPFTVTTSLAAFKATTPKVIKLWSSVPVDALYRPRILTGQTLAYRSANGSATGKKSILKGSQAYPRLFGRAVAKIVKKRLEEKNIDDIFIDDLAEHIMVKPPKKGNKTKGVKKRPATRL